mmetsp:Transcript_16927/g.30413  ORF Transcript_16927/g.30413 Transcript_16927/m.30413 type:complete len:91 (-) Transcript_16927:47-319(-)
MRFIHIGKIIRLECYPIWRRRGNDNAQAENNSKKEHQAFAHASLWIATVAHLDLLLDFVFVRDCLIAAEEWKMALSAILFLRSKYSLMLL